MAGLSERMIAVAGMVTPGKKVADIGCDHAYTAIYLASEGIASKVYAMDVAAGPLEIGRRNVRAAGLEEKIELRLSDGFRALLPGETDAAVIAGMGGSLIISILEGGREVITPGYELILSPQSDQPMVRAYLRNNKYIIKQEIMIEHQKKLYNIMRVVYVGEDGFKEEEPGLTDIYDEYGKYMLEHPSEIFTDFLDTDIEKKKALVERLDGCEGEKAAGRLEIIRQELNLALKAREYVLGVAYGKGQRNSD